ncbi:MULTISPECIES: phosphoglycerate dehydrogenase [Acetobacter]|uniref:2-oxoglutarate reductase n=2 Tax=Acetobacter TaxID=434 RepID=A0A5B9GG98_9PROT|nr:MULTISPECIES: phosphoglycerate dehydrogenase [Acetobacter]NLG90405.1 phosphoglycerate dehydrogenase [Acetobacter sp.]GBR59121.1 D-3-phosphoglycerate dehydrogenase [Acetobacter senegalensis DSM 18889]AKR49191.1 D-3-phosphoglycerate dehydrogenase [Acetobacter pasteurianus]ARW46409.1 Phosphoglycerate dehydrogenase [Acetobacter pasteurianus subsp. pasteurianus]MCP1201249.1 phosphoglycerate dehydrogenase [Acetobacter oryzoeni]
MSTSTHLSLPKDKIRILLLEGIHDSAVALLKASGYENVVRHKGALEGDALKEALEGVHIVGIRSRTQLTKEVLDGADRLMAIGCFCIGTNQVDLEAARMNGIPVFNAPYSNTRSVAELVMGEIVMLMRRIFPRSVECHEGKWSKSAHNSWEVRGKTLGIVGYGSIGSQLSVLAEAFGMRVVYYDVVDKLGHGNALPVETLEDLLAQSDVVSLHVPQLPTTKNLMGEAQIKAMKKGSFLINNARGNVVDLDALAEALKSGHLLGAAIDVYPKEPKGPNDKLETPVQGLDNVILSPHVGGSTVEAQERIGVEVARKLVEYSDVGSTFGSVNFPGVQLPQSPRGTRFMHAHRNVPGMMMRLNEIFMNADCNVTAQFLQTDGEIGYVVIEADTGGNTELDDRLLQALRGLEGTIRARLIYKGK